jgi:hypothetical protein
MVYLGIVIFTLIFETKCPVVSKIMIILILHMGLGAAIAIGTGGSHLYSYRLRMLTSGGQPRQNICGTSSQWKTARHLVGTN